MSYNTKDINADAPSTNFMDTGIHENIELTNIRYDESPNEKSKFLELTFINDRGQKLTHTEYEPRDKDDARLNSKIKNQMRRFKHIAKRYMPESDFDFDVPDFEGFALKTIQVFGDKFKGPKVRIKVVYSDNNYTCLPRYIPFIESMDVPKEESKLEIISIDKMVRDRADRETPLANPLDALNEPTTATPVAGTEGLPF